MIPNHSKTTTLVLILMSGRNYNRGDKVGDSGTQPEVTLVDILTVTYCPKSDQCVAFSLRYSLHLMS